MRWVQVEGFWQTRSPEDFFGIQEDDHATARQNATQLKRSRPCTHHSHFGG